MSRTIAREITQPAADVLRKLADALENEELIDDIALRRFARELGEPIGLGLRKRLAAKTREFAGVIERGEL